MTAYKKTLAQWLAYIEQQHPSAIAMGLDRVREVAQYMGLKQPAQRCITVGGSNGKGSTVAFMQAIALAAGWKTGVYTSPHLLHYNERVMINGQAASDELLIAGFEAVDIARNNIALTYFEYGTLAALWIFEQANLDLAILEVGLGGRLDAVNIIDADVAVITTVDIDHTDWLGNDRETIGAEKAGIMRSGKPVIIGEADPPSSVLRHGYDLGAQLIRSGCDFLYRPLGGKRWQWRDAGCRLSLPGPQLAAPVQLSNAATAIAALRALKCRLPQTAWAQGIAAAQLPGRLQRLVRNGVELLLDVGHNRQAAAALAQALQKQPITGRTFAIYAALNDKDVVAVVRQLQPQINHWYLAGLAVARGQSALQLRQRLIGTAAVAGPLADNVAQALRIVLNQAKPGDRVLVFGSFHTVAEAWQELASTS